MQMDSHFKASYEIPFGTVEMGRDEIDYSYLPDNYECQFRPNYYGRRDLPFREALNWVDVSTGEYKGYGCLFASDMTVHLFKDETENPVDYPVVQHVLLSTRPSLAWNPSYCFTQPGNHSYRMALFPHNGNWRFAYKEGLSFNNPLLAFAGKENQTGSGILPTAGSLLRIDFFVEFTVLVPHLLYFPDAVKDSGVVFSTEFLTDFRKGDPWSIPWKDTWPLGGGRRSWESCTWISTAPT